MSDNDERFRWHSLFRDIHQGKMELHDLDIDKLRRHFDEGGTLRDYPDMSYTMIKKMAREFPDFGEKLNIMIAERAESYMDMAHAAYVHVCDNPDANLARNTFLVDKGITMAKRYNPEKFGDKVNVQQDTNLTVKDNVTPDVVEFLAQQGVTVDVDAQQGVTVDAD